MDEPPKFRMFDRSHWIRVVLTLILLPTVSKLADLIVNSPLVFLLIVLPGIGVAILASRKALMAYFRWDRLAKRGLVQAIAVALVLWGYWNSHPNPGNASPAGRAAVALYVESRSRLNGGGMIIMAPGEIRGNMASVEGVYITGGFLGAGGFHQPCAALLEWKGFPSKYRVKSVGISLMTDVRDEIIVP